MKKNSLKFGTLFVLLIIVFTLFYSVNKSLKAEAEAVEAKSKVDSRFYSFDNLFFQTNSVVVDSLGNIIGKVYILTNDEEIEEFYNDSTKKKSKYYKNLKERKLKIIEKD